MRGNSADGKWRQRLYRDAKLVRNRPEFARVSVANSASTVLRKPASLPFCSPTWLVRRAVVSRRQPTSSSRLYQLGRASGFDESGQSGLDHIADVHYRATSAVAKSKSARLLIRVVAAPASGQELLQALSALGCPPLPRSPIFICTKSQPQSLSTAQGGAETRRCASSLRRRAARPLTKFPAADHKQ